jgi:hypothetical protein
MLLLTPGACIEYAVCHTEDSTLEPLLVHYRIEMWYMFAYFGAQAILSLLLLLMDLRLQHQYKSAANIQAITTLQAVNVDKTETPIKSSIEMSNHSETFGTISACSEAVCSKPKHPLCMDIKNQHVFVGIDREGRQHWLDPHKKLGEKTYFIQSDGRFAYYNFDKYWNKYFTTKPSALRK